MTVSERTLKAVAEAIRKAIADGKDDLALAEIALQAFMDNASLKDFDGLGMQVTIG